jgi:hypothetical protein
MKLIRTIVNRRVYRGRHRSAATYLLGTRVEPITLAIRDEGELIPWQE